MFSDSDWAFFASCVCFYLLLVFLAGTAFGLWVIPWLLKHLLLGFH